jgi:hypothetical protein
MKLHGTQPGFVHDVPASFLIYPDGEGNHSPSRGNIPPDRGDVPPGWGDVPPKTGTDN